MERKEILDAISKYIVENGKENKDINSIVVDNENPEVTYGLVLGDYELITTIYNGEKEYYSISLFGNTGKWNVFANFNKNRDNNTRISINDFDKNNAMADITPEVFMKDKHVGMMFRKLNYKTVDELTLIDSLSHELTLVLDALEDGFAKMLDDPFLLQNIGFINCKKYKF